MLLVVVLITRTFFSKRVNLSDLAFLTSLHFATQANTRSNPHIYVVVGSRYTRLKLAVGHSILAGEVIQSWFHLIKVFIFLDLV